MTVHLIPDRLALPLEWATTFAVDGKATARDLSYSLTVGWLAAQRDPELDGADIFLGDNGLRMALARSRRDKAAVEDGRVFRMTEVKAKVPGFDEQVAIPSLTWEETFSGGIRVHRRGLVRDGDRQQQWSVPAEVAASMRVQPGDPFVELPWSLVQNARNRMSVIVMLRVLAILADKEIMDYQRDMAPRPRHLTLHYTLEELLSRLSLPADLMPSVAMRLYLAPAAREISELTDYKVRFKEERVRYRSGPHSGKQGPLQGFALYIEFPSVETPIAFPAPRKRGSAWKPAPKFHKPAKPETPAPAIVEQVDAFPDDDDDDGFPGEIEIKPATSLPLVRRFGRLRGQ